MTVRMSDATRITIAPEVSLRRQLLKYFSYLKLTWRPEICLARTIVHTVVISADPRRAIWENGQTFDLVDHVAIQGRQIGDQK